jgi:hypothetical protein
VDWVLCHEGVLISALLDRVFLPGFEAAKALKTQTILKQLETEARLEEMESLGEQLGPVVSAIASAYALLTSARSSVESAISSCGSSPLAIFCIAQNLEDAGAISLSRTVVLLSLPDLAVAALERLTADVGGGRHPAETLRGFFTVVSPAMLAQPVSPETLGQRLRDLGLPSPFVTALLKKDPLSLDNAGLRAAVESAAAAIAAHPQESQPSAEDRRAALLEIAQARMEFERLQCHIKENWLHYIQAVAMREDHGQRFMRLQALGPIVTFIENDYSAFMATAPRIRCATRAWSRRSISRTSSPMRRSWSMSLASRYRSRSPRPVSYLRQRSDSAMPVRTTFASTACLSCA